MKLYELVDAALDLQEQLEAGEMDEQAFTEAVDSIGLDKKIESICGVLRNLEAEAEAFKAEKERLAAREKTARNAVDRLKAYLVVNVKTLGVKTVKAGTFALSLGKSKSVEVLDATKIPAQYLIEQAPKVDKANISKALKDGVEVPGARLLESEYLRIR